jgi:gas vesicle protein
MTKQTQPKDFMVGAAVGALLGTVSALLLAPKAGKSLRDDICGTYCDVSNRTQDVANQVSQKSKCFANNVSAGSQDLAEKAKCLVDHVSEWMHPTHKEEGVNGLLLGSIIGGVVGAAAGFLLAPKAGSDLRQSLADTYSDATDRAQEGVHRLNKKGQTLARDINSRAGSFFSIAQDLMEQYANRASDAVEGVNEKAHDALHNNSRLKEIADWASLGMRMWQTMKKRG